MTEQSEKIDFDKLEEQLKSGKKIRLNLHCKMCNGIIYLGEGSVIENEPLHFKCYKEQREKEIIKLIEERLKDYKKRMDNPKLPDLTKANLMGMILALEELKAEIKGARK